MEETSTRYLESNRTLWNEWTAIHERSEFYDVAGFKAGKDRLHPLEIEEVGDVSGKTLLHLQCHFGLDTLTWARRGACVTGVDFSDQAIALARSLSAETGIEANFVHTDLYRLPDVLPGKFDIVFTSYGAICWLPDIRRWAQVAAHFVRPGGTFYVAEFHPFAYIFDERRDAAELRVRYPYFHSPNPLAFETGGSYADPDAVVHHPVEYSWSHGMGDIVTALLDAGLHIEYLHEFPFCVYEMLPGLMEKSDDGYWRLRKDSEFLPLMFSIKAVKSE